MKYELTFLLNDEEELKNMKLLIESLGGKVITEEKWGRKNLFYKIKKNTSANFYNYVIEMERKNLQELRKKLNFNEKLIRYLLLQKEEKPKIQKPNN